MTYGQKELRYLLAWVAVLAVCVLLVCGMQIGADLSMGSTERLTNLLPLAALLLCGAGFAGVQKLRGRAKRNRK